MSEYDLTAPNIPMNHPQRVEQRLREEIERLRAEVTEWKRVASAQAELHDNAERELSALRERFERAPVADSAEDGKHNGESSLLSAAIKAGYYKGKRVALVPLDD